MVVETSIDRSCAREMAKVFKALGDENRAAIFLLLRRLCPSGRCEASEEELERSVGEIARHFDLALSTVSHHIKELRNAGLILCDRRGQRVHCAVNPEVFDAIETFFRGGS